MHAAYAIDDLLKVYLTGSEPKEFTLAEGDAWIQVRGARGDVQFARLDTASFAFRTALLAGLPVADALVRALEHDAHFQTASALAAVVADGLVTSIAPLMGVEA
jgi:hypothetical protein